MNIETPDTNIDLLYDFLTDIRVWLAYTGVWLYMVANEFLQGYLGIFACKAEWFNPSISQLVAFSGGTIAISFVLGVAYLLLCGGIENSVIWWGGLSIWTVMIIGLSYLEIALPQSPGAIGDPSPRKAVIINDLVFIVVPLLGRFITPSRVPYFRKMLSEARSIKADAEKVDPQKGQYEAEFQVLCARASKLDLEIKRFDRLFGWIQKYGLIGFMMALSIQVPAFAGMLGRIWGELSMQSSQWMSSMNSSDNSQARLLFTDGIRSLTALRSAAGVRYVFTNPQSNQVFQTYPNAGNIPATSPSTRGTQ